MTALVPLSPEQAVAILRQRYPEALVCTQCATLLATRKESYAKSGLSEIERLEYVCHECRQEVAEAARVAEVRATVARENLVKAREAREATRARQDAKQGDIRPPIESVGTPVSDPLKDTGLASRVDITVGLRSTSSRLRNRGGRPKVHESEKIARREASRAYRARRKAAVTS